MMLRIAALFTACLIAVSGCGPAGTGPAPSGRPAGAGRATTRPAGGEVMAYVNDKPVYMSTLIDLLMAGPGYKFATELVRHEMVRQAAAREGVSVSEEEVRAEHDRFLNAVFSGVDDPAGREQALRHLLREKEVSRKQWDMSVRTAALLRKMARPRVKVSEAELKEEFGRAYGRQVVVRHIQVADLAAAEKVARLARTRDFGELVKEYSANPSAASGGLLPPISPKTSDIFPAIKSAALAMKEVGEVSDPVQVGTSFHILRLERIIPPKEVEFEEVRDEIETALVEQRVRAEQKLLLERLIRDSVVEYVHPDLRAEEEALKARKGVLR